MTDFEKCLGHLEGDDDFLMMAGEYNVLPPKAKALHVAYVRSYGIYRCVLSDDGRRETVTP